MTFISESTSWQGLPPLRQELDFWLGIMVDHSRFMRNGFDPTEEEAFRIADDFAQRFVVFRQQNQVQPDLSPEFLFFLTGSARRIHRLQRPSSRRHRSLPNTLHTISRIN